MRTHLVLIFSAVLLSAPAGAQQDGTAGAAVPYREALRLIDGWLDAQQAYDRVPAMSVGVLKGQSLIFSKGYGSSDSAGKVAATPRTIYSVCSISKLFTAIGVLQLAENGKLGLDDEVTSHLPWFRVQESERGAGAPVTIRGLLTHTSGLPREADFAYWSGPDFTFPTAPELRASIPALRAQYRAAEFFQYSNLGMNLAGDILAARGAQPYAHFLAATFTGPLGMRDTRAVMPMELYGGQLAVGYSYLKRDGTRNLLKPFDARALQAAAGVTSTVEDMARFAAWQFRLLQSGNTEIVRAATLRDMLRTHWSDPDGKNARGLGYAISHDNGKTTASHTGTCPGYRSVFTMLPKDELASIVLTNAYTEATKYSAGIHKLLEKAKAPIGTPGVELERYAGLYNRQVRGPEMLIVPWQGKLATLTLPSDDPSKFELLRHAGGDRFRVVRGDGSDGEEFAFEADAGGVIVRYRSTSQISEKIK